MQIENTLLISSIVAGALTVVSPCIMSLLPIIVGGAADTNSKDKFNYKKAFTVIISLGISVLFFTFALKVSSIFINIPEIFWKTLSGGIIILIGLIYLFPKLWSNKYLAKLNSDSNIALGKGESKKSFWGDVIVGSSLGPVFVTCSPTYFIIIATVLPVSLLTGFFYMLTFVLGMCLFLFVLSKLTNSILNKLSIITGEGSAFKKFLGFLFILIGVLILTGSDKFLQLKLLENGYFDITKIEMSFLSKNAEKEVMQNKIKEEINIQKNNIILENENKKEIIIPKLEAKKVVDKSNFKLAPELVSPDGYINTNNLPIKLADYKNKKVVLVSIWTFSCINCKRTLPYLNTWYDKYKDEGLEIVSVHTPEFSFEKVKENVEEAVKAQGIKYPVVLDNEYKTWNAYDNNYWPRKYLIDEDGYIIYDHIGEGDYEGTELQIQKALKELNKN
jgi:cytochrome c biogenesis protein CcdA/thiol-disulfide isomerase/thioredoxin